MTIEIFISILILCATATSIGIEIIKKILDHFYVKYNSTIMAMIIAFVVGVIEIVIYYVLHELSFSLSCVAYCICMGLSNAVASNVGYDKVKTFLLALVAKNK